MTGSGATVVCAAMKKRKTVCSPTQAVQSEIYSDLKAFIVRENERCVKEIQNSNDRRLEAIEASLNFAMDALQTVSARQQTAVRDIQALQRESAQLQSRLRRLELSEDRLQQDKRLECLIFSGPAVRSLTSREQAVQRVRSVVRDYISHSIDESQLKAVIKLRNDKVLFEFQTASPGSDRDVVFRSKTKLKGSGLYVSESLTPRRQKMFQELLRLKREKLIFSVFTRSGDVMVCRHRGSVPFRVADPEAVSQLIAPGAPPVSEQGRTQERMQVGSDGGRGSPASTQPGDSANQGRLVQEKEQRVERRADGPSSSPGGVAVAGLSPLLVCAREPVSLVQLSPPAPPVESLSTPTATRDSGGRGSSETYAAGLNDAASVDRLATPVPSAPADLEPPVEMVTSEAAPPPVTAAAAGRTGGRSEEKVGEQGEEEEDGRSMLPSGASGERLSVNNDPSAGGGATGGGCPSAPVLGTSERAASERAEESAERPGRNVRSWGNGKRGCKPDPSTGKVGRPETASQYRDIRDFFDES